MTHTGDIIRMDKVDCKTYNGRPQLELQVCLYKRGLCMPASVHEISTRVSICDMQQNLLRLSFMYST